MGRGKYTSRENAGRGPAATSAFKIQRADDPGGLFRFDNVGVDHSGADIGMSQELPDGTDIVAGLKQVGGACCV
jgi:hypothetical protein